MDGQREHHDFAVCREGGYDIAVEGIREAVQRGFRVTTNTTLFDGADPESVRAFFDEMMDLGVEGMMLSPGYSYEKAPDQAALSGPGRAPGHCSARSSAIARRRWRFNLSPLFLEFLMGQRDYACTPWGMPTYNIFGWQKPCYLLQDGYAETFAELMAATEWEQYGAEIGQSEVRQLHGAQRLRGDRGQRHVRLGAGLRRHREGDLLQREGGGDGAPPSQ